MHGAHLDMKAFKSSSKGCCLFRIRETLSKEELDPGMAAALPPGAWWRSTGERSCVEPYGPHAGDAAIQAAKRGNLELRHVSFSYPLRPNMAGEGCIFYSL